MAALEEKHMHIEFRRKKEEKIQNTPGLKEKLLFRKKDAAKFGRITKESCVLMRTQKGLGAREKR